MTYPPPSPPKDMVPPGGETGVYYIPISNVRRTSCRTGVHQARAACADPTCVQLPFSATWQQVKDFLRQVAPVEHVEIFPRSTSGWIRVRGHDNFKAVFGTRTETPCLALLSLSLSLFLSVSLLLSLFLHKSGV